MGRRLRTQQPILPIALKPRGSHGESLEMKEGLSRSDQQQNFNLRHKARDLPKLQPGDPVWIRDQNRQGQVVSRTPERDRAWSEPTSGLCVATANRWFQHRTTVMTPAVVGHHLPGSARHLISRHQLSRRKYQPLQRGVFHVLQERYLHSQSHLHRTE